MWGCCGCAREGRVDRSGGTTSTAKPDRATQMNLELLKACAVGDRSKVESLVNSGADLNYRADKGSGFTPLLWAVYERNYDIAVFLLKRGANPNIADASGMLPIDFISPSDTSSSPTAEAVLKLLENPKRN